MPSYFAITESDPGGLNNVNFVGFDSLADLTALNVSSQTSWNLASGISISGLAFDGLQYHMITESDPGGLNNVNFVSFDSLADLTALNVSSQTSWNLASGVSFSALAFSPPPSVSVEVPEPSTIWLFTLGVAALVRNRVRRRGRVATR